MPRELYDDQVLAEGIRAIVGRDTTVHLQYFYGPQVALPFIPLGRFSFLAQAGIWVTLSLLMYFACVYLLWKSCPGLRPYRPLVFLCAIAYPPLFHFFVRGQISAVVLVCFTAACLAFLAGRDSLAGIALGFLVFKPQFLVAIPLLLLLAQAWKVFAGLAASAAAQLAFAFFYFGPAVMRPYIRMLLHSAGQPSTTELIFSPIQMHSLHTFWELLIPWPRPLWTLYFLSSLAAIAMAAAVWKSSSPRALRFSALILASVLVNPHIYIYDLLALAPALLLLVDWALIHPDHPFHAGSPRLVVPGIPAASIRPALPLDPRSTLSARVRSAALGPVAHLQIFESQTCLQRIRRCITLLPAGNPMRIHKTVLVALMFVSCALTLAAQNKPKLTLDEFFNSVDFRGLRSLPTATRSSSAPSAPTGTSKSSAAISGSITTTAKVALALAV